MDISTNRTEVIIFRHDLAPEDEITLRERVKSAGTVQSVRVRFYKGQELALEVNPFVMHTRNRKENLLTYVEGGKQVLSGDDDDDEYPSVVSVQVDDEICVYARNKSQTWTYTVNVDVVIDYYGAIDKVV